ncbi:pyruvate ferredoxin oxidoreductase [Lachnospiraceae bacterium WCA-9-b2]|jgi:pyruvate ferredoxin oxidoreductase alpha subunit|uniref:Pyruvate ferredoxin oxidoreductase n=1 Tax=Sporofaciens musculi TaxID=2681861 RepID=A0A7X3SHZ7_9FIRM|nr:pyruvate ferredoxin oxidoreductase [Sporofaciens musculi]MXP74907.1 pyruvate ferredoxin oxidoreductase [Sporofaciens musculi]
MAKRDRLSGNEAIAIALRQINPDVFPAFPITPSTEIPQYFASFVANGQVDTEFIPVESEHSSMSAAIGASAAGARSLTATSSCGLAYMWEELYIAASNRLPLALALVNRALSGPININCDHSDSMGARDAGWIQIYAENNQEAYDNMVQAYRISEHKDVRLPIMICQDGFITSHAVENMELLEDDEVKKFVGEYAPENYLLNPDCPMAVGPYSITDYYMEAKRSQAEGMKHVEQVVLDVAKEFAGISGREYGLFEAYCMEDAEYAVVMIGSAAGTTKDAIDALRKKGVKVGLLKLRLYRPFPAEAIAEALTGVKAVAIMDRAEGYTNHGGPLGADVMSALYRARSKALAVNYIYGLGGRDVRVEDMEGVFAALKQIAEDGHAGETYRYLGIRE